MPRYPRSSHAADGLSAQVYSSLLVLAEQSGHEVFPLHVGDTYLEPPAVASIEGLARNAAPGLHRYANVRGEPALLDAIVANHARRGCAVVRERLQVTAGGTSGLDLAARALLASGDEVVVLAPYWPLIRGIISALGALPIEVPVFTELGRPDFDLRLMLERAITPRTAAIYVNSPNNPTGKVLTAAQIEVLASLTREHGLWLFSDEAYERLSYLPQTPTVWLHPELRQRTIAMHTLSKSYGLAGARVAYLHGPEYAMERIAGLQTFATYCAARPMQIAGACALSHEGETWLAEARALYRAAAECTATALGVSPPDAGTFLFFDTKPYLRNGETPLCLLERVARAGVVLTPGSVAGTAYVDWARLCFTCVAPEVLDRALATLQRVLRA